MIIWQGNVAEKEIREGTVTGRRSLHILDRQLEFPSIVCLDTYLTIKLIGKKLATSNALIS